MSESPVGGVRPRNHIIKRPRLTRLLDETSARIILLVAPAGYGKTTLAREWCSSPGRQSAWYQCTPASADVAAFTVGLTKTIRSVVLAAGKYVDKRARVTTTPSTDAKALAELLTEDLVDWPDNSWLVLDDFHLVQNSPSIQQFLEHLVHQSRIPLLVTARERPSWVSARAILYGESLELGIEILTMTDDEASAVLSHRPDLKLAALIDVAHGWPAVIGLAALTSSGGPTAALPTSLYDYFAEELLEEVPISLRWALLRLALLPSLTPEAVEFLLGEDAPALLDLGVQFGFLTSQDGELPTFHPLLRDFLHKKLLAGNAVSITETITEVGDFLITAKKWDDAFALAAQYPKANVLLVRLLDEATEPLLKIGRLATIEHWVEQARNQGITALAVDLAEAEICFRHGKRARAYSLALSVSNHGEVDLSRQVHALFLAGRSAQLRERHRLAFDAYKKAATVAQDPTDVFVALRGQLAAASELEIVEIEKILNLLECSNPGGDDAEMHLALAHLVCSIFTDGDLRTSLDRFRNAEHIAERLDDPLLVVNFFQTYAQASVLAGRYRDVLPLIQSADEIIVRNRLDFAKPIGSVIRGYAELGLAQFCAAADTVRAVEREAMRLGDQHATHNARILKARLLLTSAQFDAALSSLPVPLEHSPSPSMVGEALVTRALAHACLRRSADAERELKWARSVTRNIEVTGFAWWAETVLSLLREDGDAIPLLERALDHVARTGYLDGFVTAARTYPRLPAALAQLAERDDRWAIAFNLVLSYSALSPLAPAHDRTLSPREREIGSLLASGLRNKEIARLLVISEATVKVHIRHIYEKLHVRSRIDAIPRLLASND